jgi:hypothetical protein
MAAATVHGIGFCEYKSSTLSSIKFRMAQIQAPMKTNLMLVLMADLLASALPGRAADSPKIEFASTVYDFGKVNQGEVVKHEFIFTNTGSATLEIKEVRPGCGCTTAGTWDKIVEPGKTGIIPLQFNTANFGGTLTKSATVTSTDPNHSNVVLQITGTIWKPIDVTPTMATFSFTSGDQSNDTKVVKIVNHLDEALTLSDLQSTHPSFRPELKTVTPGKEYEIHVTAIPPFTNRTTMSAITVKTSLPKTPVLSVTAYAMVQPEVAVQPEQLYLPGGPLAAPMSPSISIRSSGTNSLVLSDPTITAPGAKVEVREAQPGHLFNLVVSFPAGFQLSNHTAEVSVKSNHPKFPIIKVPIVQPQTAPAIARPVPSAPGSVRVVPSKLGPPSAARQ